MSTMSITELLKASNRILSRMKSSRWTGLNTVKSILITSATSYDKFNAAFNDNKFEKEWYEVYDSIDKIIGMYNYSKTLIQKVNQEAGINDLLSQRDMVSKELSILNQFLSYIPQSTTDITMDYDEYMAQLNGDTVVVRASMPVDCTELKNTVELRVKDLKKKLIEIDNTISGRNHLTRVEVTDEFIEFLDNLE